MRLVDAVVVAILMNGDAADRIELAGGVEILHVTAHLEHEHAPVAVEGDLRGVLDRCEPKNACPCMYDGIVIPAKDKTVGAKSTELINSSSTLPACCAFGKRMIKGI